MRLAARGRGKWASGGAELSVMGDGAERREIVQGAGQGREGVDYPEKRGLCRYRGA